MSRSATETCLTMSLPNFSNTQITFVDIGMVQADTYRPRVVTLTDLTLHKSTYCYEHLNLLKPSGYFTYRQV
jgi:hypothetical protein